MKKFKQVALCAAMAMLLPFFAQAQGAAAEIKGLQVVLEQLYNEMIGMSSQLIGVGRGIAGFAATWYIAYRVWRHIANAEPVDFYPLLRPFAIGLAILLFPSVLAVVNGVMKPTVSGTAAMVQGSDNAIALLLKQKEEALKKTDYWQMYVGEDGSGDRDLWYKYTHDNEDPSEEGTFASIGNDVRFAMSKAAYNFRNSVKEWMSEILQVLFQAAALCINTIRTFHMIVLAILGPLVLGISVFDGFHHSLTTWLARYINVFLWLPVANLFGAIIGKIQEQMIKMDIGQIEATGDTFFSSKDTAYMVFLIIGIVGYFTVPSVANYIVHAGGQNSLLHKSTTVFGNTMTSAVNMASTTVGGAMRSVSNVFGGSGSSRGSGSSNPPSSYHSHKRFSGKP